MGKNNSGAVACAVAAAWLAVLAPVSATAQGGKQSLDGRVTRLESLVNSGTLMELLQRVDKLQQELQQLRGEMEQQSNTLSQVKERQRELYLDLDRRLRRFEAGGIPAATAAEAAAVTAPPEADTPPATTPGAAVQSAQASPPPEPATSPGVDPAQEQTDYQKAFNLLKEGRYDQAAKAFQEFIAKYPQGRYTDNAQYWLGETFYVTRQFQPALQEFGKLLKDYPASAKLSHAMLKIGYIHHELGDTAQAEQVLNDLITRFPKTTAARLARERLQRIKLENR